MNALILTILLSNLVLEAACAYLLYKKRDLVKAAIRQYLGVSDLQARMGSQEHEIFLISRRTKFIRKAQKARDAQDAFQAEQRRLDSDEPIRQILRSSNGTRLIDAIKEYRNIHSASLLEAKNAVEAMRDRLRERGEIA